MNRKQGQLRLLTLQLKPRLKIRLKEEHQRRKKNYIDRIIKNIIKLHNLFKDNFKS